MNVKLVSVGPLAPRLRIVVKHFPSMIGRSPDAAIRVDDRWASRRHCEMDQVDGALLVRDIGSRHGTFVNGERISAARLLPGDRLTIGVTTFEVLYRPGKRPPADRQCVDLAASSS